MNDNNPQDASSKRSKANSNAVAVNANNESSTAASAAKATKSSVSTTAVAKSDASSAKSDAGRRRRWVCQYEGCANSENSKDRLRKHAIEAHHGGVEPRSVRLPTGTEWVVGDYRCPEPDCEMTFFGATAVKQHLTKAHNGGSGTEAGLTTTKPNAAAATKVDGESPLLTKANGGKRRKQKLEFFSDNEGKL